MSTELPTDLITQKEAADLLGYAGKSWRQRTQAVSQQIARGRLTGYPVPGDRLGGQYVWRPAVTLVSRAEVERLRDERRAELERRKAEADAALQRLAG
jgi:hypothetical protein